VAISNGTSAWITVLLRLPVFYNPDAAGHRASVEDDRFWTRQTNSPAAPAAARSSSSGMTLRGGSGGIKALLKETCWH
jgi:hypothetical protein